MLEHHLVPAHPGALLDRPLDHIAGDAGLAGLFKGGEKPRIARRIAAAQFRGDGDFLDQFADRLALFLVNDRAFRVQPLASHKAGRLMPA